jgi:hypothetical protein
VGRYFGFGWLRFFVGAGKKVKKIQSSPLENVLDNSKGPMGVKPSEISL